jgi:lipoic acid synthetase
MKIRLPFSLSPEKAGVRTNLHHSGIHTVCEEASCPNLAHCWQRGTATFLLMGDICTRRCGFCDVKTGRPSPLDAEEPDKIASAVLSLNLKHVVLTSVDRDDLTDGGSQHFARVISTIRHKHPSATIEALIPDFKGLRENLEHIWQEKPEVLNHNVETVPSLYKTLCPQADYQTSLKVLRKSAEKGLRVKCGLILGLGEKRQEVEQTLREVRDCGTTMLTLGQYLQPTPFHAPLKEYIETGIFEELKAFAYHLGYERVSSGPMVRSSYHADEDFSPKV